MLGNVRDTAGAVDVFAFLARYYRSRFSRAAELIRAMMGPAITLFFGLIVAIVIISIFLPLISLIQNISAPARGL